MRLAFDTSVLVAALHERHPHHPRARPWVAAVTSERARGLISWHAAAETWSVLTRLPGSLRLAPATAHLVLERILEVFRPVELDADAYREALKISARRGLRSGAIFDALHYVVAAAENADALVTFNRKDFERLASEGKPRIVVPPDPPELVAVE